MVSKDEKQERIYYLLPFLKSQAQKIVLENHEQFTLLHHKVSKYYNSICEDILKQGNLYIKEHTDTFDCIEKNVLATINRYVQNKDILTSGS